MLLHVSTAVVLYALRLCERVGEVDGVVHAMEGLLSGADCTAVRSLAVGRMSSGASHTYHIYMHIST